jgi:hypothetical protein
VDSSVAAAEDTLKILFLSLLAILPAVNTMETILFATRWLPDDPSTGANGTHKSEKIISDRASNDSPFRVADRVDAVGNHRYYGRAAYP